MIGDLGQRNLVISPCWGYVLPLLKTENATHQCHGDIHVYIALTEKPEKMVSWQLMLVKQMKSPYASAKMHMTLKVLPRIRTEDVEIERFPTLRYSV